MDKIYVQIPAYRDSELSATLLDLYAKADVPERLRTAVVWQRGEDERLAPQLRGLCGLEIMAVPAAESRGCNWARNILQGKARGEAYTLLLDSHHRFVRGWDSMMLDMHRGLERAGVAKPVLTAYLPSYDPDNEPGGRRKRPYKIYPLGREQGMLVRLTSYPLPYWTRLQAPVEAEFASLHFLFGRGTLNDDLRFDPDIYFFGDEVITGLRAFTHGYDMYHPHRVLGWHCYNRASRVPHWDDHRDWHERHARGLAKMRRMLRGEDVGAFGVGRARSIAQYEERAMIRLIEAPP